MKLPRSFLPKLSSTRDVALNSEAIHPGSLRAIHIFSCKTRCLDFELLLIFTPESLGKLFFMIQFDQYIFFKHGLKLTHQPPKQKKLGCVFEQPPKAQSFYSHGGTVIALDYASDLLLRPPKIGTIQELGRWSYILRGSGNLVTGYM